MRIFIGGIEMETNSFSPILADCDTFKRGYWLEGREIETLRSTTMDVSGFYKCLDSETDVEVCPGFVCYAVTSGPVRSKNFTFMTNKLFDSLRNAGTVDGVLLAQHGALQAENMDDCEGYIIENVRSIVGNGVPIVAVYDLHACLTKRMTDNLDGITGYMTYPHTDHSSAGYRAAKSLIHIIRKKINPKKVYKYIPMIMPVENCNTNEGPIVYAMRKYKELIEKPFVLSGGLFLTQPWLDADGLGCQMCIFYEDENKKHECDKLAGEILDYIWRKRHEFNVMIPNIDNALTKAEEQARPVCVVDLGDIISAGGCGDSTLVLRSLLNTKSKIPSCITVVDPESVNEAQLIGTGNKGVFRIGKTNEDGYNKKVTVEAEVVRINEESYRNLGETQKGVLVNGGKRVLLTTGNMNIIVSEYSYFTHDKNALISMGIDPASMGFIVQKTHQMFKAGFEGIMGSYIYADTPGYTDRNLARLAYKRCPRPIYPLDEI